MSERSDREAEQRERDVRVLRRVMVLLLRRAASCEAAAGCWEADYAEEARRTRALAREVKALAERWEAIQDDQG